ncbi:MAG: T9SS type A sorting domain-containing protein [Calditrichaeota bacterium]|nr:T9SS type A sorting domain-containing protein [Calditrichota bacterium]
MGKASAENVSNYSISGGITIESAVLDADLVTVHLKTSKHSEQQYTLTVSNVKDRANNPNTIAPNSTFQYEYTDLTRPFIVSVQALFEDSVDVTFSEPMEKTSAENIENYSISDSIEIFSAILDSDLLTVHLKTSKHKEQKYTLTVSNIKDRANNPNSIRENTTANYVYVDRTPPSVVKAEALVDYRVDVYFSEPVDSVTGLDAANYSINGGVQIDSLKYGADFAHVKIFTSKHVPGFYTLTISNVKDRAKTPNALTTPISVNYEYVDITPPEITAVNAPIENLVNVIFSEPVYRETAEDTANFKINNGIQISEAVLDTDLVTVHLTTSTHNPGTYILVVDNIQDRAETPNTIKPHTYFVYQYVDRTPPKIDSVSVVDDTLLTIYFNEKLQHESAETAKNYSIEPPIDIHQVTLLADEKTVALHTQKHGEGSYQLVVKNIADQAKTPNFIVDSLSYNYEYVDTKPVELFNIEIADANLLKLTFSESVDSTSAEMKENYSISGNVHVDSVYFGANQWILYLKTSEHEEGIYQLTISGLKDCAKTPNVLPSPIVREYSYVDTFPPKIESVEMPVSSRLIINFNEAVDENTAIEPENYEIYRGILPGRAPQTGANFVAAIGQTHDDGIKLKKPKNPKNKFKVTKDQTAGMSILSISLSANGKVVQILTTPHEEDTYTLVVKNIKDRALNPNIIPANTKFVYEYVDKTPPALVEVKALSDTTVQIRFSEKIDKASAEDIRNYQINKGIVVKSAALSENQLKVTLSTTKHVSGETYTVSVNNLRDCAKNPNTIAAAVSMDYVYIYVDTQAPLLSEFALLNAYVVEICFNEPLDSATVKNLSNYSITPNVVINDAELDSTQSIIFLRTSRHQANQEYELVVRNICDRATPPNMIAPLSFKYEFEPETVELVGDITIPEYEPAYVNVGSQCYVDSSMTVTNMPQQLSGSLWIRTAMADANKKSDNFISFQLNDSATVYIGYDKNAVGVPVWLQTQFTRTPYTIKLGGNHELVLWRAEFPPGKVTLGANHANGVAQVNLMYVVLIANENYLLPQTPDDLTDPFEEGPITEYQLHQNYPNPFNGGTEIKFEIPEAAEVQVIVYNIRGQTVRVLLKKDLPTGRYIVQWNGLDEYGFPAQTGIYFVRMLAKIDSGNGKNEIKFNKVQRMIMIK